jgi:nitrate/nitrite transporter NarK
VFQLMALWSGIGGGNFACSMSNISTFFPKRLQGTALGLNAGLGNFGVTTMQIVIPLVMTVGLFGAFGGGSMVLLKDSGWILGKIAAGTPTWIQNAGFAWVLSLVPLAFLGWFGMNNLKTVSPNTGTRSSRSPRSPTCTRWPSWRIFGLYLYLPAPTGLGLLNMWVALPLDHRQHLLVMKLAAFGEMKENIAKQFAIFSNKHTWSMTALYIVTFGSFIGFSMALPLSITVIFGVSHVPDAAGVLQHTLKNPNAPSALTYAWIGPFVGALIRPVGGWISDKVGGSIVTQVISAVMVVASAAVGYVMMQAYSSATPEQYFFSSSWALRGAVRRQRHRQRLHLPHHRRDLRPPAGRPGAGLDLGRRRLRRLHRPGGDRRPDQGRHAAERDVRLRHLLRPVPGAELVVLPAQAARSRNQEPLIQPPDGSDPPNPWRVTFWPSLKPQGANNESFLDRLTYFSPKEPFSGDHGVTTGEDRTWETPTATAGRTTRSCAPPTA